MTVLLEKAFTEAAKLPESEQDVFANWILEELHAEHRWEQIFAKPEAKKVMRDMAREALEDYRTGRTSDIRVTEDGRLSPA